MQGVSGYASYDSFLGQDDSILQYKHGPKPKVNMYIPSVGTSFLNKKSL